MNIKSVKKQEITTTVDGVVEKKDGLLICTLQDNSILYVPVNTENKDYREFKLTILHFKYKQPNTVSFLVTTLGPNKQI